MNRRPVSMNRGARTRVGSGDNSVRVREPRSQGNAMAGTSLVAGSRWMGRKQNHMVAFRRNILDIGSAMCILVAGRR